MEKHKGRKKARKNKVRRNGTGKEDRITQGGKDIKVYK